MKKCTSEFFILLFYSCVIQDHNIKYQIDLKIEFRSHYPYNFKIMISGYENW